MAITNAQQYQQLVNKPAGGKRPGYKGWDPGAGSPGTTKSGGNKNTSNPNEATGGNKRTSNNTSNNEDNRQTYNVDKKNVKTGPKKTDTRKLTSKDYDRGQSNFREQFNDYSGGARMLDPAYSTISQRNNQKYQNRIFNTRRNNIINQLSASGLLTPDLLKELGVKDEDDLTVEQLRDVFQVSDDTKGADYGDRSLNLDALTGIKSIQDYVDEGFYKKGGVFDKNSEIYDPNRIP